MKNKLKILDCTLRDGGYYNDWNYDPKLVSRYLNAMVESGVDIVELGLRSTDFNDNLGPFAFTTDDYLKRLELPSSLTIGVMINAKEYLSAEKTFKEDLFKLSFLPKDKSPVSLVRIVATVDELPFLNDLISSLKNYGYELGLNIMQIGSVSEEKILERASSVKYFDKISVLYFADSFGNLDPNRISGIISTFRKFWSGDIGIHTHDNMGLAHVNAMTAFHSGASWIDCTVLGMGRGAGNSKTENILIDFKNMGYTKYIPEAVFELVTDEFSDLQKQYNWGPNLYYYLSAIHNIHPTFVQEMLGLDGVTSSQILNAINYLKGLSNTTSFKTGVLTNALNVSSGTSEGNYSPITHLKGKNVLILAKGEDATLHKKEIEEFIKRKKPMVISLNVETPIAPELVDFIAACNPARLISDVRNYSSTRKRLLLPVGLLKDQKMTLNSEHLCNYGLQIVADEFEAGTTGCKLPYPLAFGYAVAACISGKVENVFLAGFNGYPAGDKRNNEMAHLVTLIKQKYSGTNFISLTKSIYDFEKCSLYSPTLL